MLTPKDEAHPARSLKERRHDQLTQLFGQSVKTQGLPEGYNKLDVLELSILDILALNRGCLAIRGAGRVDS